MKKLSKTAIAKRERKNLNRRVARKNAAFAKLSPPEKRVEIARDVLAQLASRRLIPATGFWLGIGGTLYDNAHLLDGDDLSSLKNVELQTVLGKMETCTGCALGGIFMCAVEKADKLKVKDLVDFDNCNDEEYSANLDLQTEDVTNYLKKFFSYHQLQMIECAFEMGDGAWKETEFEEGDEMRYKMELAAEFANNDELQDEPGERMRLIMENVVVNGGVFMPRKLPVPRTFWSTPDFKG